MKPLSLSRSTAVALSALALLSACGPPTYTATLTGDAEVPPVTTSGTGSVTATLDGNTLNLSGSYSVLSSAATAAHVHGPASPTTAGGPMACDITLAESVVGTGTLHATCLNFDVANLEAEMFYVNVHTGTYLSGEIRGQLRKR